MWKYGEVFVPLPLHDLLVTASLVSVYLHRILLDLLSFPNYPFMNMPYSKTPVVSHALAISHMRLLLSDLIKTVCFRTRRYLLTTTLQYFGAL